MKIVHNRFVARTIDWRSLIALGIGGAVLGCVPPASTPSTMPVVARSDLPLEEGELPVGVPGRAHVLMASIERRWAVLLQARSDTTGAGVVCSRSDGQHGFEVGDEPTAWLVLGSGAGEPIDEVYGATDDERYLVFSERDQVTVLDVESGERVRLGPRTAFTRWPHFDPTSSASVAGQHIVYRRGEREVVVYDPHTGSSTPYSVPSGWVFRADVSEGWLLVSVLERAPEDPTSSAEVPHMSSSAGDLGCDLVDGACEGIAGEVWALSLEDPSIRIPVGDHGTAVSSWAVTRGSDTGGFEIVEPRTGQATPIGAPDCRAQLLTLGEHPRFVAYRCETISTVDELFPTQAAVHVVVASEDAPFTLRDETARLGLGVPAWEALGATRAEAEHLVGLEAATRTTQYILARGAEAAPVAPARPDVSEPFRPHRCGDPVSAGDPLPSRCAAVGPDVDIMAMLEDGRSLARPPRPAGRAL